MSKDTIDGDTLKKKRVNKIIDYLFEISFQMDKSIYIDDNEYEYLFEALYDMFEERHIEDNYYEIMRQFLYACVANNDVIDINILINDMKKINENDKKKKENFIIDKFDQVKKVLTKKREHSQLT